MDDKKLIALFAYGTLQPGQPLASWLARDVVGCFPAYVTGYKLFANHGWSFPYMTKSENDEDVVYGTVMIVRVTDRVHDCARMEIAAGYEIAHVDAFSRDDESYAKGAMTFVCNRTKYFGEQIHHGNWVAAENAFNTKQKKTGFLT